MRRALNTDPDVGAGGACAAHPVRTGRPGYHREVRINLDGVVKQLMDGVNERFRAHMDEVVSRQYCPEHGAFASIEFVDQVAVSRERVQHEYRLETCCEALQAQVTRALQEAGLK